MKRSRQAGSSKFRMSAGSNVWLDHSVRSAKVEDPNARQKDSFQTTGLYSLKTLDT